MYSEFNAEILPPYPLRLCASLPDLTAWQWLHNACRFDHDHLEPPSSIGLMWSVQVAGSIKSLRSHSAHVGF